jgi:hypothetical protein
MADLLGTLQGYLSTIAQSPVYLLLTVGAISVFMLVIVLHHIHKIHREDIYIHQPWGANWKGR